MLNSPTGGLSSQIKSGETHILTKRRRLWGRWVYIASTRLEDNSVLANKVVKILQDPKGLVFSLKQTILHMNNPTGLGCDIGLMGDNDDGNSLAVEFAEEGHHFVRRLGVECARGFVS